MSNITTQRNFKPENRLTGSVCALLLLLFSSLPIAYSAAVVKSGEPVQQASVVDWKPVEQALGKSGSMQPGDVYKVSFPRSDLKVTVSAIEVKPALALGT